MPIINTKEVRNRTYVGKDFDGFRYKILEYVKQYYPDKLQDFSEFAMGGIFLDMAAFVGDNLSYYQDHQFSELDPDTVVETVNVERLLKSSGVKISGASPANLDVTFYIEVPALNGGVRADCLPIIKAGSRVQSNSGVTFILANDIDFTKTDSAGQYKATVKPGQVTSAGVLSTYVLSAVGSTVSGLETTETFTLGAFTPFKRITLANPHVNQIVSVTDGNGNVYYQVSALTDDVIYKNITNPYSDSDAVPDIMTVVPAPYRFVAETALSDRTTSLVFGGGSASTFEDDVIPDPSEFAVPLRYQQTFSRIAINPASLIATKTLGIVASNTSLSVMYRYGGGIDHNVKAGTVRTVDSLVMTFPSNPSGALARQVRDSVEVDNLADAQDGDDAPDIDTLKSLIPSARNSQERIVTRDDLLARVYTMPSNFGRVYRAAIRPNPNNPLSIQLHVVSRNSLGQLTLCSDSLKKNLRMYLNPYRMISDAFEIMDVRVLDLQVKFEVFIDPVLTKELVLMACIDALKKYFNIKNWQIDQPIIISDVWALLKTVKGVLAVNEVMFVPISGVMGSKSYSSDVFDVDVNTQKGFIMTPDTGGSIFEIRYPDTDIIGKAV